MVLHIIYTVRRCLQRRQPVGVPHHLGVVVIRLGRLLYFGDVFLVFVDELVFGVEALLRYVAVIVIKLLGEHIVLPFNSVDLILPANEVEALGTQISLAALTKLRNTEVSGHAGTLLRHLPDAARSWHHAASLSSRDFDQLVEQDLVVAVDLHVFLCTRLNTKWTYPLARTR